MSLTYELTLLKYLPKRSTFGHIKTHLHVNVTIFIWSDEKPPRTIYLECRDPRDAGRKDCQLNLNVDIQLIMNTYARFIMAKPLRMFLLHHGICTVATWRSPLMKNLEWLVTQYSSLRWYFLLFHIFLRYRIASNRPRDDKPFSRALKKQIVWIAFLQKSLSWPGINKRWAGKTRLITLPRPAQRSTQKTKKLRLFATFRNFLCFCYIKLLMALDVYFHIGLTFFCFSRWRKTWKNPTKKKWKIEIKTKLT